LRTAASALVDVYVDTVDTADTAPWSNT